MTGGLFDVINNLAWNVVSGVSTLASGNFGSILVFLISIGLLFAVVGYFRKRS